MGVLLFLNHGCVVVAHKGVIALRLLLKGPSRLFCFTAHHTISVCQFLRRLNVCVALVAKQSVRLCFKSQSGSLHTVSLALLAAHSSQICAHLVYPLAAAMVLWGRERLQVVLLR